MLNCDLKIRSREIPTLIHVLQSSNNDVDHDLIHRADGFFPSTPTGRFSLSLFFYLIGFREKGFYLEENSWGRDVESLHAVKLFDVIGIGRLLIKPLGDCLEGISTLYLIYL